MENADQVGEQGLPDAKLKLVQKVNNHHLGKIKFFPRLFESFAEAILHHGQLNDMGCLQSRTSLTIVGTEDVDLSRSLTRTPTTA